MTGLSNPHHHFSHRQLLRPDNEGATPGTVDAIVVPTNRPIGYMASAVRLAGELDCLLLVLCSRWSDAKSVIEEAARADVRAVAVDVPPRAKLQRLRTDDILHETPFARRVDTSMKRNITLAVAHMMPSWGALLFLDDDIDVDAADVRRAAGLLGEYDAVGLENRGFPDNSVVCHAGRLVLGEKQDQFIGAGALVVPADNRSYFPHVYNEDWFFLFEHIRRGRVAVTGQALQKRYDPFDSPRRAHRQEFGDCLAEGVFALLDEGKELAHADVEFWRGWLEHRKAFIQQILDRMELIEEPAERAKMIAALQASQDSRAEIEPEQCVAYLDAWRHDRDVWETFLAGLPKLNDVNAALKYLSLARRYG